MVKICGRDFSVFFPHLVGACDDWIHRGISSKIGAIFVCYFPNVCRVLVLNMSITQLVLVLSS